MRVAVVDIGSNSTRLLIADVQRTTGGLTEIERRTQVTRLGERVDETGHLELAAMERVFATLDAYRAAIDRHGGLLAGAVLTSAVRDAANGERFAAEVSERYALPARILSGEQEARLTFAGATSERDRSDTTPLVLVDVGGGSTELVVGTVGRADFHVSTQAGVVRQGERHIRTDPPDRDELRRLADEVRGILAAAVPEPVRARPRHALGVAGTATSLAAIDLELERYDPAGVHGHVLELAACELMLARLAAMPLQERRTVVGLHPDRAPTIVTGAVILVEALRTFGLEAIEVSEHDILRGAALQLAGMGEPSGLGPMFD